MHKCDTFQDFSFTLRNLFIDYAIDTLVGQDANLVLLAKYLGWAFCHWAFRSVLCVLSYFLCYDDWLSLTHITPDESLFLKLFMKDSLLY